MVGLECFCRVFAGGAFFLLYIGGMIIGAGLYWKLIRWGWSDLLLPVGYMLRVALIVVMKFGFGPFCFFVAIGMDVSSFLANVVCLGRLFGF